MKIKLTDWIEQLKKPTLEKAATLRAKQEEIAAVLKSKQYEAQSLNKEHSRYGNMTTAEIRSNGMTAVIIDQKMAEFDKARATLKAEISELNTQHDAIAVPDPTEDFAEHGLLVSLLKSLSHIEEAELVADEEACAQHFVLGFGQANYDGTIPTLSETGIPKYCRVEIARDCHVDVPIKFSTPRYALNFCPPSLRWIPASEGTEAKDSPPASVVLPTCYAVEKTGRLILSKTKLQWRTPIPPRGYGYGDQEKYESHSHDFKGIADTFPQIVEKFVQRAGGALEMDSDYSTNPLMERMKEFVVAQTTDKPAFKPTKKRLTSPEIYAKVIKQDWDGFAHCQWAEGMTGTLALLKYHVENGERARFWNTEFENYFGFRLRTRDHSWIEGRIYLIESEKSAETGAKPIFEHRRNAWVMKLGRMRLLVAE